MAIAIGNVGIASRSDNRRVERSVLVSVLIPLGDHRQQATRCIQSWCTEQTFDRQSYEVIAVASKNFPPQDLAQVRASLGNHDRLIFSESDGDIAQIAEAAALARGEFFFISESHAWPARDVLRRCIERTAEHPDWAGLTGRCTTVAPSPTAEVEAEMYQRDFRIGVFVLGWRRILDICFFTRRAPFFAAGGFDATLGHFAEWVLAARYAAEGYHIGYCPEIEVYHFFDGEIANLHAFTKNFIEGETAYLARDPSARRENLIEAPVEWSCSGNRRRDLARRIVRMNCWLGFKWLPTALLGDATARMAVAASMNAWWIALFIYRHLHLRLGLRSAFERYMVAAIRRARLRCADDYLTSREPGRTGEIWSAYPDRGADGAGLHHCESFEGVPFRWSEPAAAIAIDLPAGRYRIHICTLRAQLADRTRVPRFYLNGKSLADADVWFGGNDFSFVADLNTSGNNWLGWTCARTRAPNDRRRLGLPLVSILATPEA